MSSFVCGFYLPAAEEMMPGVIDIWKFHYDSEKDSSMFARTGKHLHTQQLTEKAAGHIIQILKTVPHAHCLSTVQDQRTVRKSSPGMYGRITKKRSDNIVCLFQGKPSIKKEKIERSFADSKQLHGMGFAIAG
ncbi:hypothetical protein CHCC20375_2008 [Bacillus licheniformis]|nr:hypothetical protein CHCC20375_2008 [Bacillus licheniformis]